MPLTEHPLGGSRFSAPRSEVSPRALHSAKAQQHFQHLLFALLFVELNPLSLFFSSYCKRHCNFTNLCAETIEDSIYCDQIPLSKI